ncbi:NuoM family protein [Sediminibacterium sp. C3]|uniref:complex I subunit 4 family protein n=1 Tax=Sediminibacterium sp. C3 TaxID=1267211 RepID=UPI000414AB6A|nr:NADH-quinone oxidoreductase subunit M [Sediminibacterium sp. C3]
MITLLLILTPLVTGLIAFFLKQGNAAKNFALLASVATAALSLSAVFAQGTITYDASWLASIGSRITLKADGMAKMLTLLTAVSFPVIFTAIYNNTYKQAASFYGLMLLSQAGLMGVFLAADALLFYFFWELALIPVYFLCSIWGGEKRIAVTFKFFVYTFVGSLLMLIGLLFMYFNTADQSFSWQSFQAVQMSAKQETVLFWLFFIAFAIKMPIFPFHTWQPDAYKQSPTATTMVMSGIMVKMGVFAVIRWLLPMFPVAAAQSANLIIILSVIGMIYASLIAIRQDDIKRMIAYSSIAHIGLMSAAMFTNNATAMDGVMIQMFSHGVNVIGLWIIADLIEKQLGTTNMKELGGLAQKAPVMAILLVVMALANVALPLTNAFIGEFLMFNGLFQYNMVMAGIAGISIILAAVYTLNMVQRVIYGNVNAITEKATEIPSNIQLALVIITLMILVFGVYPQPLLDLTGDSVSAIFVNK